MFPCACALRSTQCAALIALAAAAGIVRVEERTPSPGFAARHTIALESKVTVPRLTVAPPWWFGVWQLIAGKKASLPVRATPSQAHAPAEGIVEISAAPPLPEGPVRTAPVLRDDDPLLVEPDYGFPYAVGPPRFGSNKRWRGGSGCGWDNDSIIRRRTKVVAEAREDAIPT